VTRRFLLLALAAAAVARRADGAAPAYTNAFSSVTLDGTRLGEDTNASPLAAIVSVVYDPAGSTFHLWVDAAATNTLGGLRHATSTDGVHFTSTGSLTYASAPNFGAYGATGEPQVEFPRVARLGSAWKLLLWTENFPGGSTGVYNYNESVNDLGASLATLAVAHQGPVYPTSGAGTFGQTTGPWGLVSGNLYVQDDRVGGLARFSYADATPPSVGTPSTAQKDLITGTGFVYFLTNPGNPLGVYVHNVARVLDQGDGTLGVFYALRYASGVRVNKQIYYAESGDGGATWSAPAGIFANGALVNVDGLPNTFEFSHPEVTLAAGRRVLYFSTRAADGHLVVATSAAQASLGALGVPALAPAGLAAAALALAGAGLVLARRL
jgi:hypothetical protein